LASALQPICSRRQGIAEVGTEALHALGQISRRSDVVAVEHRASLPSAQVHHYVQAAWAASRQRDSYLRAQFLRLKGRRGAKKAILAVAASMLTATYYMLRDGAEYHDLGADHFDRRDRTKVANRLIRRLEQLGLKVQVEAAA
jgi:hypothetical protein